jgi:hypothetical protein
MALSGVASVTGSTQGRRSAVWGSTERRAGVNWVDGAGAEKVSAIAGDSAGRNFREPDGASGRWRSMRVQQAGRRCAVGLAVLLIAAVGGCGSTPISSSGSSSHGGTTTTVAPKSADRSSLGAQPAEVIDFTPVSASGAWAVTAPTAAPGSANRGIERTVNAGAAWTGVTSALPEGLSGRGFTAGDFLNRREAWVPAVSAQQVPKTAELFATTDGGHSWQDLGRLPPACYSSSDSIAAIPSGPGTRCRSRRAGGSAGR